MSKLYKQLIDSYISKDEDEVLKELTLEVISKEKIKKRSEFINTLLIHALTNDNLYTKIYIGNILQQALIEDNKNYFTLQWDDPFVSKELIKLLDETNYNIKELKRKNLEKTIYIIISIALVIFAASYNFVNKRWDYALYASITFIISYIVIYFIFEKRRDEIKFSKLISSKADYNIIEFVKNYIKNN